MTLTLSGCGGGGGSGSSIAPSPNPRPNPNCVRTTEGCLTPTEYQTRVESLRLNESNHDGFSNQWGLGSINADAAWAKIVLKYGANTTPGAGITLGAIDSGIDTEHQVFSGKKVTEVFLNSAADETGSSISHGTAVASVMVAAPSQSFITDTTGTRGVAWGADITMFAVPTGSGSPSNNVPISLSGLNSIQSRWVTYINSAVGWSSGGRSLDFVNVSLGHNGIIDMYSKSDLTTNFGRVINALKQSGSSNKTVFVWAAGNSHGDSCDVDDYPNGHKSLCDNGRIDAVSPEVIAGLPTRIPELRGNHIAVVAIDNSGSIASFSNRCGIAADWCIAAPGQDIRVAYFGPDPNTSQPGARGSYTARGTSYAAPMVTGALGVMKHFFRSQLSNTALVSRLYATANKSGIYKDKSIYGQGLMDLNAATTPVGFTLVTQGNNVRSSGKPMSDSSLILGMPFGDGLNRSFANQQIAAFDELGAPFWYSLDNFAYTASGPSIQSRLTKFMGTTTNGREFGIFHPALAALPTDDSVHHKFSHQRSLGLMDTPDIVDDGGHLSLLGRALVINQPISEKLGFSLFSTTGDDDQAKLAGMEFVSQVSKTPIIFRNGMVSERQSLLRSSASGAFGEMSGNSIFTGVEGNLQVDPWRLSAGAEVGTVFAEIDEGILSVKSPLITSAFALRAGKRLQNGDTLTFALSQPVRIESGLAEYSIPVGRTIEGRVLKTFRSTDLEPSGRQIDLSAIWHRSLPPPISGDFRLTTGLAFQPGHRATAHPELSVLAGWRLGY